MSLASWAPSFAVAKRILSLIGVMTLAMQASVVNAQTTPYYADPAPSQPMSSSTGSPVITPAAQPAVNSAITTARDPMTRAIEPIRSPGTVTLVGSGNAVSGGVRVLKGPGACKPKTNSLDCADESGQSGGGANVSGRVRGGVIGEVGAGRAATEGKGGAQRKDTCVPVPGKLTCGR